MKLSAVEDTDSKRALLLIDQNRFLKLVGPKIFNDAISYNINFPTIIFRSNLLFHKMFQKLDVQCSVKSLKFTSLQKIFNTPDVNYFREKDIMFHALGDLYVWKTKFLINAPFLAYRALDMLIPLWSMTVKKEMIHKGWRIDRRIHRVVTNDYLDAIREFDGDVNHWEDVLEDHMTEVDRRWHRIHFPFVTMKTIVTTIPIMLRLIELGLVTDVYLEAVFETEYALRDNLVFEP